MNLAFPRPVALSLLVAWSAAVAWLMLSPKVTDLAIARSSYLNNLGHAAVFGLHCLLVGACLRRGPVGRPRGPWLLAATLALAYSVLLEWRQGAVPGRVTSAVDVVTNAVGAFGAPWALAPGSRLVSRCLLTAGVAAGTAAWATWGA